MLGPKTGPLFESPQRSLLKSGLLPMDRCGTCQETISRRLGHMYTQWLREGPLYKSVINVMGSKLWILFKSFLGHY